MRRLEFLFLIVVLISMLALSCGQTETGTVAQTRNSNQVNSNNLTNSASNKSTDTEKETRPTIISRKEWQAAEPVGTGIEHSIRFITIHHTAVLQKPDLDIGSKMRSLQKFSQSTDKLASGKTKPAWFDVPYHFYIAVDGKIADGRDLKYAGDTNTDYDPKGHALIVVEGNFEEEEPTAEQIKSLGSLVRWLSVSRNILSSEIKAHDDYAVTACPGKNLKSKLSAIREGAAKKAPGANKSL
jgi:hypothetical protein